MTTIKAMCYYCNEVELPDHAVTLCTSNLGWAYYHFTCPSCHQLIEKDANLAIIHLLTTHANVRREHVQAPAEVLERQNIQSPTLTPDDLLDFALHLAGDVSIPEDGTLPPRQWPGPT